MREVAAAVLKIGEALLQMQRHRIVDLRADPALCQELPQRVAALHAQDVLVEDVAAARAIEA